MISVISTLGSGGYAKVYKVSYKEKEYALKHFIDKEGFTCPWELEILSRKIPGVLYYEEKVKWEKDIAVLLPLAKSDLRRFLLNNHIDLSFVISSICQGLANLHSAGFIHLDLKPENILVFTEEVLIADFSISLPSYLKKSSRELTTLNFRPPELFFPPKQFDLSDKLDSWSFGILLLEVLCDYQLKGNKAQIHRKIYKDFSPSQRKITLAKVPKEYYTLVDGLLQLDPQKRLSICDFCQQKASDLSREVYFYSQEELSPYYKDIVALVKDTGGSWMVCISAITLITEYYNIKKKVYQGLIFSAVKLAYQIQEDTFFDYSFFTLFGQKKEGAGFVERDLLLTLPSLAPSILLSPYPHLLEEELEEKI